jgi:hypothetical protein
MVRSSIASLSVALTCAVSAQTTIFTEEFETGGVQSMSAQWVWTGSAPVFTQGCTGSWGLRKETPIEGELNNIDHVEHWLFHPLPYNALLRYNVSATIRVQDPDQGGENTFDEPFAFAGLAWMNMTPGAVNGSISGDAYSSEGICGSTPSSFYYNYGGSPGADWQFGIVLASISPPNTTTPMWVQWDHVMVKTVQGAAQFVGTMLLGGAYNTTTHLMNDNLRQQGLIPLTEPYTALGWPQAGGGGGETTTAGVLNGTYSGGRVVDWVRLELRQYSNSSVLVASRQALVLQNGTVISAQGSQSVLFGVLPSSYWVAVRHRNHLGAMLFSQITVPYPGGGIWSYNFTGTSSSSYYGTNALKVQDGKGMLWEGDVTGDHQIKYTGSGNDRDPILTTVGSTTPNASVAGYLRTDVNLDGTVKYTGSGNDRDAILLNVGSTTPNNTRLEQMP